MIEVYLRNPYGLKSIKPAFLKNLAIRVARAEKKKTGALSLIFVSSKRARELNARYRKKYYTPEVLSFEGDINEKELGEIVLCPAAIKQRTKAQKTSFEKELAFCLVHGLLHLLGYNHGNKKEAAIMEQKEKEYLDRFL